MAEPRLNAALILVSVFPGAVKAWLGNCTGDVASRATKVLGRNILFLGKFVPLRFGPLEVLRQEKPNNKNSF